MPENSIHKAKPYITDLSLFLKVKIFCIQHPEPYFLIFDDLKDAFILGEIIGLGHYPIGIEINLSNSIKGKSLRIGVCR